MKIEGGLHINYVSFSSNVVPIMEKELFLLKIVRISEPSFYPELSASLGGYPNSSLKHFAKYEGLEKPTEYAISEIVP
jgi:hypothetical protein